MANSTVFENLTKAFDAFERAEKRLALARKWNESQESIAHLQERLIARGEKVDVCWDAMNDSWRAERLSKFIG